ncbi:MAG: DNA mismatch repair protein MutL [Bacteroidetes bacterium OLB12]|nr:MAG: DNA mismatch repair protein MutL [Bacteroidetes bacterium OLB12]HNR73948.1 DNA mismatch repair endonuclease MutL [Cyclobacteriaceae bacterium]
MPDIIHLLPDSIANQIAAGEVVQRPASAVKELMENSLDAGATQIRLFVKEAGKTLIQVIDNGSGMSETDARMSLERHATSKIRTAEDLFRLRTMGFRGEALASIAAVSQFELKTRQPHADLGTHIVVEGSEVKSQTPTACEKGTNISIKNLFFNIPARRNFLKSNPIEMRHIIDEFQRLALAHPQVAFQLKHDEELIYDLPPAKLNQRIVSIFGKSFQGQLAPCQEETTLVKITGYIGRPESARKTRGEQFIFVNQRYIRNNYLNHAVTNAFEGLLQEGSFPFYVLFIEIDPKHIDVNVHPTKTEIKFDDERAVYGVVWAAVKQALSTHNLAPAIDFKADVNLVGKLNQQLTKEQYVDEQFSNSLTRSNLKNWETLFENESTSKLFQKAGSESTILRFESALNKAEDEEKVPEEQGLFQFQQKYIVRASKTGLMIIDQQAAHERVLFERYLARQKGNAGNSQQSLFPQTVTLSASDYALAMEIEQELFALGFRFEIFGKHAVLVTGIPTGVTGTEKELFEGLIEQFKKNQAELQLPVRDNLALALARRAAVKSGQKLLPEEIKSVVEGLFACSKPNFSPDGRPTFFTFETSKIESYFTR